MSNGDDSTKGPNDAPSDDDGHTAVMTLDQMRDAGLFDDDPPEPPAAPTPEPAPVEAAAEDDDAEHTMMMDASIAAAIAPEAPKATPPPAPPAPAVEEEDDAEHTMMMDASIAAAIAPEAPKATPPPVPPTPAVEEDDDGEHTMMMDASVAAAIAPEAPKATPPPAPPAPAAPPATPDDGGEHTMMMDASAAEAIAPGAAKPAADPVTDNGEHTVMMDASAAEAIAPEPVVGKVTVQAGADKGRDFSFGSASSLVGRGLDCDVILNDASVSRKHFRIDRQGDIYTLVNLSQGNGTKVNGVKVNEVRLRHGSVIEVGTTTMRWVSPDEGGGGTRPAPAAHEFIDVGSEPEGADSTRMCDLADLEAIPGWKPPAAQEAPAARKGGAGRVFLILFLVIIFLGGVFVAVDKFAELDVLFAVDATTDASSAAAASAADDDDETPILVEDAPDACQEECGEDDLPSAKIHGGADNPYPSEKACLKGCMKSMATRLAEEGALAMGEETKDWALAIGKFKAALKLNPNLPKVNERLKWAKRERRHEGILQKGTESLTAERAEEALNAFRRIPARSIYYNEAQGQLVEAEASFVSGVLATVTDLRDGEKFTEALAALAAASKVVKKGGFKQLTLEIRADQVEVAGEAVQLAEGPTKAAPSSPEKTTNAPTVPAKTAPTVPAKTAPTKPNLTPIRKTPTTPRRPKTDDPRKRENSARPSGSKLKGLFASATAKYRSEDFAAAQAILGDISRMSVARRHKKKAQRMATKLAAFATQFRKSMGLRADNFGGIKVLNMAINLDKQLGRAHQRRLKKKLASIYAFKAQQYLHAGKFGNAGNFAKKALARDPGQSTAKSVYNEVRGKAQAFLDKAKANSTNNPDAAIGFARKALRIFQRGENGYVEANRLLLDLEDEDEDEDEE